MVPGPSEKPVSTLGRSYRLPRRCLVTFEKTQKFMKISSFRCHQKIVASIQLFLKQCNGHNEYIPG